MLPEAAGPVLVSPWQGVADGAMVLAQSALALGATLATCLALAPKAPARAAAAALAFCASALAAGWLAPPLPGDALAAAVLLVLGIPIAAGVRWRGWPAWIVLPAGGAAAGIAGGLQTASRQEALGGAAVLFLLALGLLVLLHLAAVSMPPPRLARAGALARRMAGAWIAAVGVLMLALWMRGTFG